MRRTLTLLAVSAAVVALAPSASAHPRLPSWQERPTGTTAEFRGLAPVSRDVAWVAGTSGTVLRTTDGGRHWIDVSPAGASALQFRDIEAFDARNAVALTIGPGDQSRVYRTTDGGAHWQVGFTNTDDRAFYDCMAFFDRSHGIAMSDPVDGKFRIIRTSDGGASWAVDDPAGMPPALDGEFGFAASGTCLVTAGPRDAWLATGGGATARVLHSRDGGHTWQATDTPVRSGPSAGIYALAMHDPRHGLAIGGDYTVPDSAPDALALTADGGRTWHAATGPGEYRSGAAWLTGRVALAVGPTGSDISADGGRSWHRFDSGSLDSVECTRDQACWGSGVDGRVVVLRH
ncbi:WD40/YVTN/BNR-like repeat-containing protein [Labedaea rhizosphaerae]|nr:oxidoreductase [Labedaea rhizosphaerae]